MSNEKKRVPQLRFPGFVGEWEENILDKVSEKITEKNKYNLYTETLTNSAEYGIISQRDFFDKDISNEKNLNGYYIVRNDDFVYNPRISNWAPVGPINRNKLGKTGVVSPLYYVFKINGISKSYLEYYFETTKWHKFMKLNGDSGARSDRFAIKDAIFKLMPIPYPCDIQEQNQIGAFFTQLDQRISLQERKLADLQQLKRGLLQKMFPKDGATVPEVRFPGFTGEWERKKLGTLATFTKGQGFTKNDLISDGYPIILYGQLYTNYQTVITKATTFVEHSDDTVLSEGNEVIVPASGETAEDISRASFVAQRDVILGGDLNIIRPKPSIHPTFLALSISNGSQQREMMKRAQGKSVVHLHNSDLKNVELTFPSFEEQESITKCISSIDNLISHQQTKLTHLQKQKKALLQQMFV